MTTKQLSATLMAAISVGVATYALTGNVLAAFGFATGVSGALTALCAARAK